MLQWLQAGIIQSEHLLELKKLEFFKEVENNSVRLSIRLKEVAM